MIQRHEVRLGGEGGAMGGNSCGGAGCPRRTKKADKEALKGVECKQCKTFYDALELPGDGNGNSLCDHHNQVYRVKGIFLPQCQKAILEHNWLLRELSAKVQISWCWTRRISSKELADPENLELRSPSSSKAGVGGLLGKVWSSFAADRGGQRGTLAEVENRSGRTLLFFEKNREVWKRNLFRLDPLQTLRLSPECLIDGAETYTRVEVLVLDDRSGKPMTTRPIWIEPFDFVMYKKIIVQGAGTALEILKV
ncbi:hypothetical protein SELMODRAFT_439271 [Selaginella moellendorffii]|uniref:Uncharacterized protein n=1 Tax=Selaginella moellendorffii TaxID=88036 RepID=D8R381_SELML|nr:hypothetical protein SELMODRAFT_439271 [Selaginella moellendorffii]